MENSSDGLVGDLSGPQLIPWLVGPRIQGWPLPLRTIVMTAVLVPLMVYVLLPGVQRLLAPWLRPSTTSTEAIDPAQR